MAFSDVVRPDYSVKYFRPGFYKLVHFKRSPIGFSGKPTENKAKGIEKHEASISRARSVVFQLAMCNSWEYFFTGTLNPEWHDRHNLDRFRSAFAQWIRDQRKKYRSNIRYVFVAERHKDGAWHLHGLLSGIPQDRLSRFVPGIHPRRLVGCAFYLEKYLTKDVERSVTDDYEFCACGYVRNVNWVFWCEYCEADDFVDLAVPLDLAPAVPSASVSCPEWEQMVLEIFP